MQTQCDKVPPYSVPRINCMHHTHRMLSGCHPGAKEKLFQRCFPYGNMDLDSIPSTTSFGLIATGRKAQGMADYLEATSPCQKIGKLEGGGWGGDKDMK